MIYVLGIYNVLSYKYYDVTSKGQFKRTVLVIHLRHADVSLKVQNLQIHRIRQKFNNRYIMTQKIGLNCQIEADSK